MCNNKEIKELLPAYLEGKLDSLEQGRVKDHLYSCEDCGAELYLLRLMAEEAVPDPGDTFWAVMPDRVYRAVREQKKEKKNPVIAWLSGLMDPPQWAWATATMAAVLIMSWSLIKYAPETIPSAQELADESTFAEPLSVAELSQDELGAIDTWAGNALASIASEAEQAVGKGNEDDFSEEVADLNRQEAKYLLKLLDRQIEEASS